MALINCPECGKEVSDRSEYCIHCGFPLKEYFEEKDNKENSEEAKMAECPYCGHMNIVGEDYCESCEMRLTEYRVLRSHVPATNKPNTQLKYTPYRPQLEKKKGLYCPKCKNYNIIPIDTKKKFSIGKAVVGNTVGFLMGGPIGGVVGAATGINGKTGKTKFLCQDCGKVFENKI